MQALDATRLEQAFADLGVHPRDVHALRSTPWPHARVALQALKDRARKNFRRLAVDLHPDRTGGDEVKTERFKLLSRVRDDLEKLEVRPTQPAPRLVPMHPVAVSPFPPGRCALHNPVTGATFTVTFF